MATKMIQIRNVPEDIHRKLKVRAALAGLSLSEYLLQEIRLILETPTLQEFSTMVVWRDDDLEPSPAEVIREERGPIP